MEHSTTAAGWRRMLCLAVGAIALTAGMTTGTAALDVAQPTASAAAGNVCKSGFVWREAVPGDLVCVTPASRQTARNETDAGPGLTVPGSTSCRSGSVWRESRPSDLVCVPFSSGARDRVLQENYRALENVVDPYAAGRTMSVGVTTRSDSLYRYVVGDATGLSPNGRVEFWANGIVAGRLAWIGASTTDGNGNFSRRDLRQVACSVNGPSPVNVVALDVRSGRISTAGSTTAYRC